MLAIRAVERHAGQRIEIVLATDGTPERVIANSM